MKALTRRLGVALVIITHNLGVVARYANRVNVMYAGRIVEIVDVPFAFPRAAEIRSTPEFAHLTGEVSAILRGRARA